MCFALFRYLIALAIQQGDAADVSTSPLGLAGPSGFSDSFNHRWCGSALGDTRNTDSGYVLRGRLPSYLAIERTVHSSLSLGSYVMVLETQHGLPVPLWIQTTLSNPFSADYCC